MKEAPSAPPQASAPLTAEDKYRLLLEVSETANSQLEMAAVLEAVAHALAPAIAVGGVSVTTVEGDSLVPHALYIQGVERRQGDTFADVVARWLHIPADQMGSHMKPPVPLAGSGTE